MINTMKQGFDWIIEFFRWCFSIVESLLAGLVFLFNCLQVVLTRTLVIIDRLPLWLKPFCLMFLSFAVLRIIISHNIGGSGKGGN